MTKRELIEELKPFLDDHEVVAEWDGGWSKLEKPFFQIVDGHAAIVFDVSEYGTFYA